MKQRLRHNGINENRAHMPRLNSKAKHLEVAAQTTKVQGRKDDVQTVPSHPKVHYSTAKPPYDQHGLNNVELSLEQRSCCRDELLPPYLSLDIPLLRLDIPLSLRLFTSDERSG